MAQNTYPKGWDEQRVQGVLAHYENQTEDEAEFEDEATFALSEETMIAVPVELAPAIRELVTKYQAAKSAVHV